MGFIWIILQTEGDLRASISANPMFVQLNTLCIYLAFQEHVFIFQYKKIQLSLHVIGQPLSIYLTNKTQEQENYNMDPISLYIMKRDQ